MANRDRREALRGAEEETFDLLAEVLTSDKWGGLLNVPLERAARQGNRGLAQKLVRAGAKIGGALHEAAWGGHGEFANDLLENGAPVDAKDATRHGHTPLHVAAEEGKTEMVQLLLLKGADKDATNHRNFTPLYLAALFDHVAVALALMDAGADMTLVYGPYKRSVAQVAAGGGYVDVLRAAIEHGADVDAVDTRQDSVLHWAARNGRAEAINVLLEAGANTEARNRDGRTPLHEASVGSNLEAVLALLKHGADVNAQDKYQRTPLHWAAAYAWRQGAVEVVDSLLRSGADETILDKSGEAAAGVVPEYPDEEYQVVENVERVRELLANAPADRAWRRRGYLVLCRAHPDRMRQIQDFSSSPASTARISRSGSEIGRMGAIGCGGPAGASPVDARCEGDWAAVVSRVLVLQEEGIFRAIVGYL